MKPAPVYLDHNATSPVRPEAREAIMHALDMVGNPSSIHAAGRAARRIVEDARVAVAAAIGAKENQIFFTSGGTEAASTLVASSGALGMLAVEHACVRDPCLARNADILLVDSDGLVLPSSLEDLVAPGLTVFIQAANNETGVLQPLEAIGVTLKDANVPLVCDAVQIVGREAFDVAASGVYSAFISGHKFGGPKGAGAIYARDGAAAFTSLIRGGGQERRMRSGTENVPGIAGMAAALTAAIADRNAFRFGAKAYQDMIEDELLSMAPDAVVFGQAAPRLANTTCFAIPGLRAETLLIAFDLEGVALSSGSACSSGKVERSHVLEAMGVPHDLAYGALRVSTGWNTTDEEISRFLDVLRKIIQRRPASRAA